MPAADAIKPRQGIALNSCLQQSCHHCNAGCAAELAQEAVDAGGIGAQFRAKGGKGERAERGE